MKFSNFLKKKNKKIISCAVLMTDGEKFLAIHPTGFKKWEIPKGEMDEFETEKQTAQREFLEETGTKINITKLNRIGKFPLHPGKDVVLFTYSVENLPSVSSLRCQSTFIPKWEEEGKPRPEVDKFKIIKIEDIEKYIRPDMKSMIIKAFK
jgi:predicted NUDIX family NTP pyrophosphohydrolase